MESRKVPQGMQSVPQNKATTEKAFTLVDKADSLWTKDFQ